jgi:hypothetical protein
MSHPDKITGCHIILLRIIQRVSFITVLNTVAVTVYPSGFKLSVQVYRFGSEGDRKTLLLVCYVVSEGRHVAPPFMLEFSCFKAASVSYKRFSHLHDKKQAVYYVTRRTTTAGAWSLLHLPARARCV